MDKIKQRSVFIRLAGMQLVSVCVSLLIIGVLFGGLLQKYYSGAREWNLIEQGSRIISILHKDFVNNDLDSVRQRIYTLAASSDIDLWIIGHEGNIVAGSWFEQEDHTLTLDPAEVEHVLAGNNITKKVMGPDYQNLLVVQAIYEDLNEDSEETIGALAMRAPLGGVGETINSLMRLIIVAGAVAGVIVFGISLSMAKDFAKPLEQLKYAAIDIAHSNFRQVSIPSHSSEVDLLVDAFNYASTEIKKTAKKQKSLEKIRNQFLSDLSHELRAPLTTIRGFLELMEEPLPEDTKDKYRQIMLKDTLYLERLVDDVLAISKMESGYFILEKEWLDLRNLVNEALETLEIEMSNKNITVNKDFNTTVPKLNLDAHRMRQVIINLLINGVHHTEENSVLTIKVYQTKQSVVLEFSDQGPGIPAEHLPYIWERFYKLDRARTRTHRGSGLGLAIVKQIVEAHQGHVSVESSEGHGTTFKLIFPY